MKLNKEPLKNDPEIKPNAAPPNIFNIDKPNELLTPGTAAGETGTGESILLNPSSTSDEDQPPPAVSSLRI